MIKNGRRDVLGDLFFVNFWVKVFFFGDNYGLGGDFEWGCFMSYYLICFVFI